jgi:hypothetical protein
MNILIRVFGWFYAQSLKLYPKEFRTVFNDEMNSVFKQAIEDLNRTSEALRFFLRELRGLLPNLVREHWHSLTKKEFLMTIIKKPEWTFYPAWVLLTVLSIPIAFGLSMFILGLVMDFVGDTIYVNGIRHFTEDYLFNFLFFPTLFLLSGLLQYSLLRRYAPKMGWWILATGAGGLFAVAVIGLLQLMLDSTIFSLWNGTLVFATIGGMIGLSQWVFLRRHIPKAYWWIFASILGWGLAVLGSLTSIQNGSILAQLLAFSLPPAIVASFAWWHLLKPKAQQENQLSG